VQGECAEEQVLLFEKKKSLTKFYKEFRFIFEIIIYKKNKGNNILYQNIIDYKNYNKNE
jgi:hypothetical protein